MSVEQINRVCREETSTRRIEKKGEREIDGRMCVYICERIYHIDCAGRRRRLKLVGAHSTHTGRGKIQRRWPGCYYSSLGSPFLLISEAG